MSTQSDWNAYAAAVGTAWGLCASCEPVYSGKKIFRQYNLNRQLLGLPVSLAVPAIETICDCSIADLNYSASVGFPFPPRVLIAGTFPTELPFYIVANCGLGLANPVLKLNIGNFDINLDGPNPTQAWLLKVQTLIGQQPSAVASTVVVRVCNFYGDGRPGPSTLVNSFFTP